MTAAFLDYAEFRGFWDRFAPETPFGREEKDQLTLHTDGAVLEGIWDLTEVALGFLAELDGDPVRASRVSHHLKRLPRFPTQARAAYGEVELFQFKKFLHNYRSLMELLSPGVRTAFGFGFASAGFCQLLDTGRQSAESFYVADEYDGELKAVRDQLRALGAEAQAEHQVRLEAIRSRWGFDFGHREFLLVARAELGDPAQAAPLLAVEPYDDQQSLVRPLRSAQELLRAERRESLLARERALEEQVLERLSAAARGELDRLADYAQAVRAFDLAFARARLARTWNLTRPVLAPGPVRLEGARFLPCQETCAALGSPYRPLDAAFDAGATVVFGSNMGGKTVVLKTLAFLQLCAQTGLFAPALAFTTRVFRHFHYVGEGAAKDAARGLSGFGCEIRQFNEAFAHLDEPTLALFDEFARTTQSQEAEALLSGVLEAFTAKPGLLALFSTHFRGVRRLPGVRYLRMRGLDRAGLAGRTALPAPEARIRLINEHMDYRLTADDGTQAESDALAVASLLGLDPGLVARAEHFLRQGD